MGITRRKFIKSTIIIVGTIMATDHFTDNELMCGCGCLDCYMQADFMQTLERIRVEMNRPLKLSSAKRCATHNAAVSSTGTHGPHTDHGEGGQAVDVLISGADALRLVETAKKFGMTGIGVKQNGPAGKRFIHLDNLGSKYTKLTGGPRPWLWSYA
jgi:zinc D-Ala-D-Ala carboxypeptidase